MIVYQCLDTKTTGTEHRPMSSPALVRPDAWEQVSGRRGPARSVVVGGVLLSIALVGGAILAVGHGLTRPALVTDGSACSGLRSPDRR